MPLNSWLASEFDIYDPASIYVAFYGFMVNQNLVDIYDIDSGKKTSFIQNNKEVRAIHLSGNGSKLKVIDGNLLLYSNPYPYRIEKYNTDHNLDLVFELNRKEFVGITKPTKQEGGHIMGAELKNRISHISAVQNKYFVVDCIIDMNHVLDFFTIDGKYISSCELPKGHELGDIVGNNLYTFTRGGDDYPEIGVWEITE